MPNLKEIVYRQMDEMFEVIVHDLLHFHSAEYADQDFVEDYYRDEWTVRFDSEEEWWDFIHEEDLTIRNMNELLAIPVEMEDEYGRPDISTVDKLLRLYGYWTSKQEESTYIQRLHDRLSEMVNNSPPENNQL